jgi:hypothetical protein
VCLLGAKKICLAKIYKYVAQDHYYI